MKTLKLLFLSSLILLGSVLPSYAFGPMVIGRTAAGWGGVIASGGTETTSGDYKTHAFTSSGTFTVTQGGDIQMLMLGGGGISVDYDGGAGAGELVYRASIAVAAGSKTVVIGAPGNDSTFNSLTAKAGGTGNGGAGDGATGGSGQGASSGGPAYTGGASTASDGVGYKGGNAVDNLSYAGGGGAGAAGQNAVSGSKGNGGVGLDYSAIFGTTYGEAGWFGGGGPAFYGGAAASYGMGHGANAGGADDSGILLIRYKYK
ncbi:MAG: hypothetical protein WC750_06395 [Patescibacteria group bacterium]|jgi:hypothetical protein